MIMLLMFVMSAIKMLCVGNKTCVNGKTNSVTVNVLKTRKHIE